MIDLENLYFEWLLTCLNVDGVEEGVAYVGGLLHNCEFKRRVGNDVNRSLDGLNLRRSFLASFAEADYDPHVTNALMQSECSWFEMLVALAKHLDFQYDGGSENRFVEMLYNINLSVLFYTPGTQITQVVYQHDQALVDQTINLIDESEFNQDGLGGLFPLRHNHHPDQRGVELWDQQAAYFSEQLEGVLWTSTE